MVALSEYLTTDNGRSSPAYADFHQPQYTCNRTWAMRAQECSLIEVVAQEINFNKAFCGVVFYGQGLSR